jgi:glyoxylase-like metal-dependent hydrolase (beta-lactamase superfamily II)
MIWGMILVLLAMMIGSFGFLTYKIHREKSGMHALDTQEIIPGIFTIKDDTYMNLYILKKEDTWIAIDAAKNPDAVRNELKKLNIDPWKISAVFLTHSDRDHVGAVKLFKNAVVYIPSAEEQMINGTTRRMLIFNNKLKVAYRLLQDGQEVEIGKIKVQSILTPGHTPGSSCYLVEGKYLFTGDTLALLDGKVGLFNHFFNMDDAAQRASLSKLATLPDVQRVFTAHYGMTDHFRGAFENWGK